MTDAHSSHDPADPIADTGRFQAFVEGDDQGRPAPVGVPFRLLTLVGGLLAAAILIWLLFLL